MKFDFLKTPAFYLGLALMTAVTILAVCNLEISLGWKIVIVCGIAVIYSCNQAFQFKKTNCRMLS